MAQTAAVAETAEVLVLWSGEIGDRVPHRGQALCISKVEWDPGKPGEIRGFWTPGETHCDGHFKIVPGHWMSEFAHLSGAILACLMGKAPAGMAPALIRSETEYKRSVLVGTPIAVLVRFIQERPGRENAFLDFEAEVRRLPNGQIPGKLLATVKFTGTPMKLP